MGTFIGPCCLHLEKRGDRFPRRPSHVLGSELGQPALGWREAWPEALPWRVAPVDLRPAQG